MTVKDAVLETLNELPVSQQKELLRFAQVLKARVNSKRETGDESKEVKPRESRIVMDEELGLPVLTAGEGAPIISHEQIREMLADFP